MSCTTAIMHIRWRARERPASLASNLTKPA